MFHVNVTLIMIGDTLSCSIDVVLERKQWTVEVGWRH